MPGDCDLPPRAIRDWEQELILLAHLEATTPDHQPLTLRANIDLPGEAQNARIHGAQLVVTGEAFSEFAARIGNLVVESKLPTMGTPKSDSYEGDGYVIVRHPDTEVVKKAMTSIIETIQDRGYVWKKGSALEQVLGPGRLDAVIVQKDDLVVA